MLQKEPSALLLPWLCWRRPASRLSCRSSPKANPYAIETMKEANG